MYTEKNLKELFKTHTPDSEGVIQTMKDNA